MSIKKWSALLGAVAVIGVAGCADRNENGQPDSAATSGEIAKTTDKMSDAAGNVATAAGNQVSGAGDAMSAAAMTPKIKTALGNNASLAGSKIDVDSLPSGITLSGTVKNATQKKIAVQIAKQNAPNYKIIDNIRVGGGASPVMNKPAPKKAN